MESLEKISWTSKGFINKEGKKVNPELIGKPVYLSAPDSSLGFKEEITERLNSLKKESPKYKEVNAYTLSELVIKLGSAPDYYYTLNFLKI